MTINIEELMAYVDVKEGKEDELVDYLRGKMLTPEGIKKYLEKAIVSDPTTEERRTVQPFLDKYHNKGLESWKKNHLESIIEDEVTKRNPGETPEQKRIRALEQKLEEAERKEKQSRLKSFASDLATQKNLPLDLVGFFVGPDETATEQNIETLDRVVGEHIESQVKARFRDTGRDVFKGRQPGALDLDKLKEQYASAAKNGMKLQERVALSRRIQELEKSKE